MATGTLLLIEDDIADQRLLGRALKHSGVAVELNVACDGEEALDSLTRLAGACASTRRRFLVLTDINLPRKSGWEVMEWARGRSDLASVPILVWTSLPTPEGSQKARHLGAAGYYAKPSDAKGYAQMASLIARFLED